MAKKTVLILCTGNSARSQMAEGLINHFLGEQWQAQSAGTKPAGFVHPLAVAAMADLGIDIGHQRSKSTDEFRHTNPDLVITVCDNAAQDCPVWLGKAHKVHIGFPDPASVNGKSTQAEKLAAFQRVRDGLRDQVLPYLQNYGERE